MVNLASFWKPRAYGQTVLPKISSSVSVLQKEMEKCQNSKKFKCDILDDFQTMWPGTFWYALDVYFQCKKSYKMI